MAYDAFIKLEGIKGEATAKGFEGAIAITSFSFGVSNPVSAVGSSPSAGKSTLSSFSFSKLTDSSSPPLFVACASGKHFPAGSLHLRKATGTGGQVEFMTCNFEGVWLDSVSTVGAVEADVPHENISFAFQKIEFKFSPVDSVGKLGSPVSNKWDALSVTDKY